MIVFIRQKRKMGSQLREPIHELRHRHFVASRGNTRLAASFARSTAILFLEEDVGFEPTDPFEPPDFKSGAISLSANLPNLVSIE